MATITGTGVSSEIIARILNFLNSVENPEEITGLGDNPDYGYGDQINDYDIGITVATRIVAKRDSLGGFTEISQLSDISGFGLDKFYDLVAVFARFIRPLKSGVFRFVTVRNPKKVNQPALPLAYAMAPEAVAATSLVLQMTNTTVTASKKVKAALQDNNPALDASITKFKTTANYFANSKVQTIWRSLLDFHDWLTANKYKMTFESVAQRAQGVKILSATNKRKFWDTLLANFLQTGPEANNRDVAGIIVADHFLTHYKDRELVPSLKELRKLASATIVVPNEISTVIMPLPVEEAPIDEPANEGGVQETIRNIQDKIKAFQKGIDDLRAVYDIQKEMDINAPRANPYTQGESPQARSQSSNPSLITEASTKIIPASTLSLMKELFIPVGVRLSYAIEKMDNVINNLTSELWGKVSLNRRIVQVGGALWAEEQEAEYVDSRVPAIPPQQSKFDDYHGFYLWNERCRIKPLGVADLRRVEQELMCYVPGEVAHIENILQGEYKERSTRRLRRSEETFTQTTEREELSERDSVTTDRYELEKETSKIIEKDLSFDLGVTASYFGPVKVTVNSNFATSNSSVESDREASFYAQDVTERSLQRIIERVREERTTKIIDEYEENNKHGLDNRLGDHHVVGLYRWADKIYKAQVVNYGKRLMLEFTIAEPAAFHLWAMTKADATVNSSIVQPIDPRSQEAADLIGSDDGPLNSASDIYRSNYALWASAYGANVSAPPQNYLRVGGSIEDSSEPIKQKSTRQSTGVLEDLTIPEGYEATYAYVTADFASESEGSFDPGAIIYVCNTGYWFSEGSGSRGSTRGESIFHSEGILPVSYRANWTDSFICNVEVDCYLTDDALEAWKIKTYDAIIRAYEEKKAAYDLALAEAKLQRGIDIQGTNPLLNRSIEQNELKKGCLNWMYYGRDFNSNAAWDSRINGDCYPPGHHTDCVSLQSGERVQFLEQAFEWKLMTYTFYPYYYGRKCRWRKLYQLNDTDPLFLNFLQAGMARVLVPVRPGYEEAIMHFLRYQRVWNGGYLPAINSPIYLSIVDELKEPVGVVEGEPWEVRIPTSLTVLQCESGCVEGKGLPCGAGDGFGTGDIGVLKGTDAATINNATNEQEQEDADPPVEGG